MDVKTITLVAKGPSAEHAQSWINACPETEVATINESILLLNKSVHVKFCFFTHIDMLERCRSEWNRIEYFVSPLRDPHTGDHNIPEGFPVERWERYRDNACDGDIISLRRRIKEGEVAHHHTTTGAHSYLSLCGFDRIRLIGVDGGTGIGPYAPGMSRHPAASWDCDVWKRVQKNLALVLKEDRNTETIWFESEVSVD